MKGTIKWYNFKKHFGFITGEDGKDYFVHASALPQGERVQDGQAVTFDGEEGERGLIAKNVVFGNGTSNDTPAQEESIPFDDGEQEE